MSKRNCAIRADNLLRRASANTEYSARERALFGVIAEILVTDRIESWGIVENNEYIKSVLKEERRLYDEEIWTNVRSKSGLIATRESTKTSVWDLIKKK